MTRSLRRGVFSLLGARMAAQLTNFCVILYAAHRLEPAQYALVGISIVVIGLFDLMSELGLGLTVVQSRTLDKRQIDQIFWLAVVAGLGLTIVCYVAAPAIGWVFRKHQVVALIQALSGVMLVNALSMVPYKLLQRDLRFGQKATIDAGARITSGCVSLALLWLGFGAWALIYGYFANSLAKFVLSYTIHGYRPAFQRFWVRSGATAGFGLKVIAMRFSWYLRDQSDKLIGGRLLGQAEFGYYAFAFQITRTVFDIIQGVMSTVALPLLARAQDNPQQRSAAFVGLLRYTMLVAAPLFIGGALTADTLIQTVFSAKWIPAIAAFQVACIVQLLRLAYGILEELFMATGRPGYMFKLNVISISMLVPSFVVGAHWGMSGLLGAWLVVWPVLVAAWTKLVMRMHAIPLSAYVRAISPVIVAVTMMTVTVVLVQTLPRAGLALGLSTNLLVAVGMAASAYTLSLAVWDRATNQRVLRSFIHGKVGLD